MDMIGAPFRRPGIPTGGSKKLPGRIFQDGQRESVPDLGAP
jgi:hypothetical protein